MPGNKPLLLIIDDDSAVRQMLYENFTASGFDVIAAADGEDALRRLENGPIPDLVITDIVMPRKEGLEVIIEIRKKYPHIRIIAISGGGRTKTTDFLALAEKLGADAILAKPFDLDELEKIARSLLS